MGFFSQALCCFGLAWFWRWLIRLWSLQWRLALSFFPSSGLCLCCVSFSWGVSCLAFLFSLLVCRLLAFLVLGRCLLPFLALFARSWLPAAQTSVFLLLGVLLASTSLSALVAVRLFSLLQVSSLSSLWLGLLPWFVLWRARVVVLSLSGSPLVLVLLVWFLVRPGRLVVVQGLGLLSPWLLVLVCLWWCFRCVGLLGLLVAWPFAPQLLLSLLLLRGAGGFASLLVSGVVRSCFCPLVGRRVSLPCSSALVGFRPLVNFRPVALCVVFLAGRFSATLLDEYRVAKRDLSTIR